MILFVFLLVCFLFGSMVLIKVFYWVRHTSSIMPYDLHLSCDLYELKLGVVLGPNDLKVINGLVMGLVLCVEDLFCLV